MDFESPNRYAAYRTLQEYCMLADYEEGKCKEIEAGLLPYLS